MIRNDKKKGNYYKFVFLRWSNDDLPAIEMKNFYVVEAAVGF